ncbi:hypothetical protein [Polaromonas sp. CG9_12]|nr:hypothetical protein [Polaromonas sp. CG9_12]
MACLPFNALLVHGANPVLAVVFLVSAALSVPSRLPEASRQRCHGFLF